MTIVTLTLYLISFLFVSTFADFTLYKNFKSAQKIFSQSYEHFKDSYYIEDYKPIYRNTKHTCVLNQELFLSHVKGFDCYFFVPDQLLLKTLTFTYAQLIVKVYNRNISGLNEGLLFLFRGKYVELENSVQTHDNQKIPCNDSRIDSIINKTQNTRVKLKENIEDITLFPIKYFHFNFYISLTLSAIGSVFTYRHLFDK